MGSLWNNSPLPASIDGVTTASIQRRANLRRKNTSDILPVSHHYHLQVHCSHHERRKWFNQQTGCTFKHDDRKATSQDFPELGSQLVTFLKLSPSSITSNCPGIQRRILVLCTNPGTMKFKTEPPLCRKMVPTLLNLVLDESHGHGTQLCVRNEGTVVRQTYSEGFNCNWMKLCERSWKSAVITCF